MSRGKLETIEILNQKPRELPAHTLPTGEDMILALQYAKRHENLTWAESIKNVSLKVIEIWNKATISTNTFRRVFAKLQALNQKFLRLLHTHKVRKSREQFIRKCKVFCSDALKLFDICSCKCTNLKKCSCMKANKVNSIDYAFLMDQRTVRKMVIGSVDLPTFTKVWQKRADRRT